MTTENIHLWGLDAIEAIQTHRTLPLDYLLIGISQMGSEYFYLIFIPLVWWFWDAKFAFKLSFLFFLSAWCNAALKEIFMHPRPYDLIPNLALLRDSGYGFPSGHTQQSTVFWLYFASYWHKKWPYFIAGFFVLLMGFSRVYVGAHFPTDILAGILFGFLFLIAAHLLQTPLTRTIQALPRSAASGLIIVLSILGVILIPNMASIPAAAALSGILVGVFYKGLDLKPTPNRQTLFKRALIGFGGVLMVYLVPKLFIPKDPFILYAVLKYIHYFICGTWLSYFAPRLFERYRV
jgi:membrane-associated phospholipid phosphatase